MGNLIKSSAGTVQAPTSGGGLAIYIENSTGEAMLKDIYGNVESLSNFIKNNSEENENNESGFYLMAISESNTLDGKNSVILSGEYNVNRGNFSVVVGGESNTTSNRYSVVGGGKGNTVDSEFGVILGGSGNTVNGRFSSVLAGQNNKTQKHINTHIIGSNVVADRDDATFVENLSIIKLPTSNKGLPKGSIWNNKGVLNVVE
jgi:hypothetical protein